MCGGVSDALAHGEPLFIPKNLPQIPCGGLVQDERHSPLATSNLWTIDGKIHIGGEFRRDTESAFF